MNFALVLFLLLIVTFVAWLADRIFFRPRRRAAAASALAAFDREVAAGAGIARGGQDAAESRESLRERLERQPVWLEYTAGLFPVILVVFVLRSFVAEPFKIPSESMLPTLAVGDLILVNKFSYGIRLPVIHTRIADTGSPRRGEVMVFRYPSDPSLDYIKRVVGLPGDEIAYLDKRLTINGLAIAVENDGQFKDPRRLSLSPKYSETIGEISYNILTELEKPPFIQPMERFPHFESCRYSPRGVSCKVPAGHYFVMGDNRENSLDSRFWGFVPEDNIVGKAFFIWMNFSDPSRIGRFN